MTTNQGPEVKSINTFSLSTTQSSKNQPFFFKSNQGDIRVWGNAVLRYFWRGFAEILIVGCGIAVFQDQVVFVFYQFGKFRCATCGILLFFDAVLPFSELPLQQMGRITKLENTVDNTETKNSHLLIEEPRTPKG